MSPRDEFSLERLRRLREHDEQRAREDFAASLNARLRGEAMLREAQLAVAAQADASRSAAGNDLTGNDLLAMEAYMERLRASRAQAELSLDRHDAEVEARRVALGRASQRRQVLDRLKERRRVEARLHANRAESAQLDEIALAQHRRSAA